MVDKDINVMQRTRIIFKHHFKQVTKKSININKGDVHITTSNKNKFYSFILEGKKIQLKNTVRNFCMQKTSFLLEEEL